MKNIYLMSIFFVMLVTFLVYGYSNKPIKNISLLSGSDSASNTFKKEVLGDVAVAIGDSHETLNEDKSIEAASRGFTDANKGQSFLVNNDSVNTLFTPNQVSTSSVVNNIEDNKKDSNSIIKSRDERRRAVKNNDSPAPEKSGDSINGYTAKNISDISTANNSYIGSNSAASENDTSTGNVGDTNNTISSNGVNPETIDNTNKNIVDDIGSDSVDANDSIEVNVLLPPQGIRYDIDNDKITLFWNAADDAVGYRVSHTASSDSAGVVTSFDVFDKLQFEHSNLDINIAHYYQIQSLGSNSESVFSAVYTVKISSITLEDSAPI